MVFLLPGPFLPTRAGVPGHTLRVGAWGTVESAAQVACRLGGAPVPCFPSLGVGAGTGVWEGRPPRLPHRVR